jgi:hypothetical protein
VAGELDAAGATEEDILRLASPGAHVTEDNSGETDATQ